MANKMLRLSLTAAFAETVGWDELKRLVAAIGEMPDALVDVTRLVVDDDGVHATFRPFRNAAARAASAPLPDISPIEWSLSWAEVFASPGATDLVAAAREAVWALASESPKLLRGSPPLPGHVDTRLHLFAEGTLIEI
jgi:hypothetical protein